MNTTERISIYKVELEYCANKNYLMFIPSINVSIWWTSLYIKIKWFFFELTLMFVFDTSKFESISFYATPHISLYRLNSRCGFKEKWDLQIFWLWMGYRKFFGQSKKYTLSLKEQGREIKRFSLFNKKK